MKFVLTAQEMKACENQCIVNGTSEEQLIERAATALFGEVAARFPVGKTVVFCGGGNNGRDGLTLAKLLKNAGREVTVVTVGSSFKKTASVQIEELKVLSVEVIPFSENLSVKDFDIAVDAMLGTGLDREISDDFLQAIRLLNDFSGSVIGCDIPSGLSADSGEILGECVKADLTVTFGAYKLGMLLNSGRDVCGEIVVKEIGIPVVTEHFTVLEANDVAEFFPIRLKNTNKGDYGKVTVIAGCDEFFGAALLSDNAPAALRAGSG